jgi:23S rRNA pseudouridine2605 synthase
MTADNNSNLSDEADAEHDAAGEEGGDRVAKVLARAGVASRREIERMIEAGRVSLNGKTLTTPAIKIAPGDKLRVDGKVVDEAEAARVWRYHKPVGLVTSHNDPKGRPTVFDHLPKSLPRVISVGRLDLNSEGLLLLTNDGELARSLELPGTGLRRRYRARARGRITQEKLNTLRDGVTVEGVAYGPIEATLDKAKEIKAEGQTSANLWITLTLSEGKNREVRKVLDSLGLTVNRLIRQAYGPFQLGDIAAGQVEEIGPRVIREQLAQWIAPEKLPQGSSLASLPVSDPKIRTGGGKGALSGDAAPKTYKAGWAKPKIRPSHPKRPDGKSRRPKPKA